MRAQQPPYESFSNMKISKTWVAAAAIVALCGTAQAALVDQGNATVLDTNTNLVWLQNMNLNSYQPWNTLNAWAEDLTFAGSSNWQLPTKSEFDALFTAYGGLYKTGAFTGVQGYYATKEQSIASPNFGGSYGQATNGVFSGTAVRAVPAPIPEPQTYVMMALGLAAIGGFVARRRKQDPAA